GRWVRDDSGIYAGYTVPRFYDTLMAKLIVWASDREGAIARMARALAEYHVSGVRTTLPVLRRIIGHPDFAAGRLDTHFMERFPGGRAGSSRPSLALVAPAVAAYEGAGQEAPTPPATGKRPWSPPRASRCLGLARAVKFEAQLDGEVIPVEVTGGGGRYRVLLGEETLEVDARPTGGGGWSLLVGDVSTVADVMEEDGAYLVHVEGEAY